MISIKYLKRGSRQWESYFWPAGGNSVVEVDAETAAVLLRYDNGRQFALAEDAKANAVDRRKLAVGLGVDIGDVAQMFEGGSVPEPTPTLEDVMEANRAEQLRSDFGIKTVSELAHADEEKVQELVKKSGASKQEVTNWIDRAKSVTTTKEETNG